MQAFLDFFETIPTAYRTAVLAGGLALFWMLESAIPLFSFGRGRIRHAALNIFFTATTLLINLGLAVLLIAAADFTTTHRFGLLYAISLPAWLRVVCGLLLLDLIGAYVIHWLEHRFKVLWRFHLIHHTDTRIDVTSGLRHHPGEALFRAVFTGIAVLVAGTPIAVVLLYQSLSAFFAQLTHANIRSPEKLDRLLSLAFVTPNMHKVHHHYSQPLTDTNYGNIFSLWDRLFGTFASVPRTKDLVYGIDTHLKPEEHDDLPNLLAIPFQKYRPVPGSKFYAGQRPDNGPTTTLPPADMAAPPGHDI